MKVSLTAYEGPSARPLIDVFLPVYAEVYAEAPYNEGPDDVAEFREHSWGRRVIAPGFRLVLAVDSEGAVAGFTFGHSLTTGTRWWDGALTALPVEATERPQDVFAIIELAVRQSCRRQGVARLLHDELVADVHADRTTLLVRPEAEADAAQRAYASWGYRRIGQIQPWPDAPIYEALLRRMSEERRVSH